MICACRIGSVVEFASANFLPLPAFPDLRAADEGGLVVGMLNKMMPVRVDM